jgi:hypothetical protein
VTGFAIKMAMPTAMATLERFVKVTSVYPSLPNVLKIQTALVAKFVTILVHATLSAKVDVLLLNLAPKAKFVKTVNVLKKVVTFKQFTSTSTVLESAVMLVLL